MIDGVIYPTVIPGHQSIVEESIPISIISASTVEHKPLNRQMSTAS
jgi:hypothetical protein